MYEAQKILHFWLPVTNCSILSSLFPEVGPVGETLAAMGAAVRLVPGVGAQVALQQPGTRERLAAQLALVRQVVRQHVHRQRRHAHVHLVADRALLRVRRVQGPVGLPVAREIAARRIVLPAFRADILGLRRCCAARRDLHNNDSAVVDFAVAAAVVAENGGDGGVERGRFLGAAVAGEKGLVGVGGGGFAAEADDGGGFEGRRRRLLGGGGGGKGISQPRGAGGGRHCSVGSTENERGVSLTLFHTPCV
jgi:hypothetical protein